MRYFESFENLTVYNLTDKKHLENHLNYLLRTDKGQKWTNKYTAGNFIYLNNEIELMGESLEERLNQKATVVQLLKEKGYSYKDLRQARLSCPDPNIYFFDDDIVNEIFTLVDYIALDLNSLGYEIILVTGHQDQPETYLHFHLLIAKKIDKEMNRALQKIDEAYEKAKAKQKMLTKQEENRKER